MLSPSLPKEAEQAVLKGFQTDFMLSNPQNVQVELTGSGKLSPLERQIGAEELLCVTVSFDSVGNNTSQPFAQSGFVKRTGNLWQWSTVFTNDDWQSHACPGTFRHVYP